MKNKILLAFVICLFVCLSTGCRKGNDDDNKNNGGNEGPNLDELLKDEPDATEFRVYFNLNDGSEYNIVTVKANKVVTRPSTPVRNGYNFLGWYTDVNGNNAYDFSSKVTKSIMLYAIWEEVPFVDYQPLIEELVPSVVSDNFELPKRHPENDDIFLAWYSSDPQTISDKGVVNPGYEKIVVTITMEVNENGNLSQFSKDVEVEPLSFRQLMPRRTVFGYYASYNFAGYTEDQLKCDVINLSFAYVNADYSLDMSSLNKQIIEGALAARKQGVRVVLSVQGYGDNSRNFSNAAKTPESRAKFIENIVKTIEKYHFDGVDLDWEYPGWFTPEKHQEAENYNALVKELDEALNAKNENYLLTAALPGGSEGYKRFDLAECSKYLDYIHLMTYDLEVSSKVYHHTALYSNVGKATGTQASVADSVELFMLRGVPASKIVVGIAFYGKYTTPESSSNAGLGGNSANGKYTSCNYTYIYNNILNRVGKTVTEYWDDKCKASYLYDSQNKWFVTYESEKSISAKVQFMRDNNLGGVMIWELGEDKIGNLMDSVLVNMKKK